MWWELRNIGQEEAGRRFQNKVHLCPAQGAPGQAGFPNPEHYISATEYPGCGFFSRWVLWAILVNVSIPELRLENEAPREEATII